MNLKTLSYTLSLAFLVWACHSRSRTATGGLTIADSVLRKIQVAYTGKFNKGLVSLVINYISGNTVSGYDVHSGQRRNLNGEVTQQGNLLSFVLKEPGGNPTDGRFEFVLNPDSMKLVGQWIPFDTTKAAAHKFTLVRGVVKHDYDETWEGAMTADTLLTFKPDGTCIYAFYKPDTTGGRAAAAQPVDSNAKAGDSASSTAPENPTSQLISVRGNYTRDGLTYKLEWEKNPYIPAHMTLVKQMQEMKSDDGTSYNYPVSLKGNGFTFTPPGDDDSEVE